ncbi:MAG: hypothetical protein DCC58_05740 [Chloroflexi bacterium]|nr:MAG: hypothetical protein DCC58_05740 [Chloroflexota bacterium]
MKFGRVEGLAVPIERDGELLVQVTVYLETDLGIETVRQVEVVPERFVDGKPDLYWEADQWTQDTINSVLFPRGWELLGATDPPTRDAGVLPRSPRYALRTSLWVPPPGWFDDPESG